MSESLKAEIAARRVAEAVAWHTELHEVQLDTTPDFETWVKDPANAQAWRETVAIWDFVGTNAHEPEVVRARTAALNAVQRAMSQRRAPSAWKKQVWAVAAAILVVSAATESFFWLQRPDDYISGFGERRVIRLADGSRVSLDSDSEVTVRYSRNARELHLLKGQARFDVAHDVERPFSVLAGDEKVIATGTAFNIDLTRPNVTVTLIEGHVVVLNQKEHITSSSEKPPHGREPRQIDLKAGQELVASESREPTIKTANVQQVTAWTAGQLIFSNETLSDVVARVNHYSSTPIVIADPEIGKARVSGVFNTGDVSGFLEIMTQVLPLQVSDDQGGSIVLKKKS